MDPCTCLSKCPRYAPVFSNKIVLTHRNYSNRVHCMQLVHDCDKEIDSVKRVGQWSPVSITLGLTINELLGLNES